MIFLRRKRPSLSIDMAPLIDIVFLLLIFFMLSSSFLRPSLKLELPQAVQEKAAQRENIVVSIDKDEAIYVNTHKSSLHHLQSDVLNALSQSEKKEVFIQGDQNIPYGFFIQIMDNIKQAGVHQINLIHEQK